MHKEILSENQSQLIPLIKGFSSAFGLAGGTAIALHLGHRRSIDFDLFIEQTLVEEPSELTIIVNSVKLTFYKYPFKVDFTQQFETAIKIPNLTTLAAMKAFALGRRAKWKDYVDLYFEDIDYSEKIDFIPEFAVLNEIIMETLTDYSLKD